VGCRSTKKKSEGDLGSTEKKGGIESRIKVIVPYARRVRAALTMLYGGGGNALLAPFAKAHMFRLRRHNPVSLRSTKRFLKEYSIDLNLSRKDGAGIGLIKVTLVSASLASLVFTIALEPEGSESCNESPKKVVMVSRSSVYP
jgi:hypothetical protein